MKMKNMTILTDVTKCIGCEKCVEACRKVNNLPEEKPWRWLKRIDDLSSARWTTIVDEPDARGDHFVRLQCRHCLDPSCVSACIVGALHKTPEGPVVYNSHICIGCRYCMIACPFQIPAYEYNNALTPHVRKCTFCFEYVKKGGLPACAQVCPREVMTFGKRSDLLKLARWKMKNHPDKYVDHIYGEHEVGGTSWLYLASEPFDRIGFPRLGTAAPPRLTEAIQHGIFRYMAAPVGLYLLLGGIMWSTGFFKEESAHDRGADSDNGSPDAERGE